MNEFTSSSFESYANDAAFEVDHGAGAAGDIYWNTTEKLIREHNGTAWQNDKTSFETQTDTTTTGSNQDITPNTVAQVIRFSNASLSSIRSIIPTVQKVITLVNAKASGEITIVNESAGATAANRIVTGTGQDFRLSVGQAVMFIYDIGGTRWRMIGGGGGGLATELQSTGFTAVAGKHYLCNTSAGSFTATLPAGVAGAVIRFSDDARSWATNPITITPATGESIDGLAVNTSIVGGMNGQFLQFMWDGSRWVADSNRIPTGAVNACSSSTNANGWTSSGAGVTVATTVSAAELPLAGIIDSAIKITAVSGTDYARFRWTMPTGLKNSTVPVSWYQLVESGYLSGDFKLDIYTNSASNYGGAYTRKALRTDVSSVTSIPASNGYYGAGAAVSFDAADESYYELRITRVSGTKYISLTNVRIGPGDSSVVPSIGNWQSYTPTLTNGGTTSTNNGRWRQVGSTMEVETYAVFTGTGSAAAFSVGIPSGYTIDTRAASSGAGAGTPGTATQFNGTDFVSRAIYVTGNAFFLLPSGGTTPIFGNAIVSGHHIGIKVAVPIAEWAGSVSTGPAPAEEFVSNSSTTVTTDTTSFVKGSTLGTQIPNGSAASSFNKRVEFQYPIQSDDEIVVELQSDTGGPWLAVNNTINNLGIGALTYYGTANQGIGLQRVTGSSTQVDIVFGRYPFNTNATFGAAGTDWSTISVSTVRWRVRKTKKASLPYAKADSSASGLVAPRKGQSALTVTSTVAGWTTARAVGVYYQDQDGNHRLKFNIAGTVTTGTYTGGTWTISGVTFKNISNYYQAIAPFSNASNGTSGYVSPGLATIIIFHASSAGTDRYGLSGDIELDSKPSWA